MKTITKTHLDIGQVRHDSRRGAYLEGINNILHTTFLSDPFNASFKSCYLGPVHLIELAASPRRSERTPALIAHDRQDGISVQLAIAGRSSGEARGRRVESVPGTLLVLDYAQPFYMADVEDRDVINVSFPRTMFAGNIRDVRALHGQVIDPERGAVLAAHLQTVAPRLEKLPVYAAPVMADIMLDLLLIALMQDRTHRETSPSDRRMMLATRARQVVDARLGSGSLTPEWLMAKLNVSRTDLYSLFEDHGGVAKFILRRRLESARAALIDPFDTRKIGEIALALGFSSEAHFSRAFRAAFDVTAGEMRRSRGAVDERRS